MTDEERRQMALKLFESADLNEEKKNAFIAGALAAINKLVPWEARYAIGRASPRYHHVHPDFEGRAHCRTKVVLDMRTLTDKPPTTHIYCGQCHARSLKHQEGKTGNAWR